MAKEIARRQGLLLSLRNERQLQQRRGKLGVEPLAALWRRPAHLKEFAPVNLSIDWQALAPAQVICGITKDRRPKVAVDLVSGTHLGMAKSIGCDREFHRDKRFVSPIVEAAPLRGDVAQDIIAADVR